MSYESQRADIETRFNTQWASFTPVQFDDLDFDAPIDTSWVQVRIMDGEARNASVGNPTGNVVRHAGVVAIVTNIPKGQGAVAFTALADKVEDIFRNWVSGGLRFMVPYVSGGATEVGAFTSRTIMCPFTRDEFNG